VRLVAFYHFNLNFKTIKSENSFMSQVKGIFIRFLSFKSEYKEMTADDFCFNEMNKAKIRFIFLMIVFVDLKLLIFFY